MLEAVGKYVGGKVLTALLVLGCAGAGIWFWNHPEHLAAIWTTIKYALAWIAFVVVLPWAAFLLTRWVVSKESNTAVAVMLGGYTLIDAIVAMLLVGGIRNSFLTWTILLVGFLAAGVYNFLVCEYHAMRLEDR